MNKSDFIAAVHEKNPDLTKNQIASVVNSVFETIRDTTTAGEPITLIGFATFEIKDIKERQGRNPKTGEPLTIPARRVVSASLSKNWSVLKD